MFSSTLAPLNTQRVGAALAFDDVAAVARVPDEPVVAGAEQRDVVAAAAGDDVVAVAADQHVGAVAADDGVVAGAAVDRQLDRAGRRASTHRSCRCRRAPLIDERVVGAFRAVDRHLRRQPGDRRPSVPLPATRDVIVAAGAIDGHGVRLRRRRCRRRASPPGRWRPASRRCRSDR